MAKDRALKVYPKKRLPTSPMKTLTLGKLRGRKPRHADNTIRLKELRSFGLSTNAILKPNFDMRDEQRTLRKKANVITKSRV